MTPTLHAQLAAYVATKAAPGRVHVVGWVAWGDTLVSMPNTHFAARFVPTHLASEVEKYGRIAERIAADHRAKVWGADTLNITHGVEVFGAELAAREAA